MHELLKKLMTEEEFNSLNSLERMAIENEARKANSYLDWHILTRYANFREDTIRQFADKVDWTEVSRYPHIREAFIEEFKDKLNWQELSHYYSFSKNALLRFVELIDWDYAPTFQRNVDEEVIEAVLTSSKKDQLNWHSALVNVTLSEAFIEKHDADITKANKWELIGYFQDLSEKFMEKFADKLNWNYISQRQHLSREFMIKHFNKLNKFWLKQYQKNWDDDIEKEYEFYKAENNWMKDQNLLNEVKIAFTKHGYDFDIFSKFFTNNL